MVLSSSSTQYTDKPTVIDQNKDAGQHHEAVDPYFALLERPGLRVFGLDGASIAYRTPRFDLRLYESSSQIAFESEEEAYRHWLTFGRGQGYTWAEGKDTILKIVLKAKDETDLIDLWIAHHASIVGYDNLIIMDCGSTDPSYIAKLTKWSDRLLILRYWSFYNDLHAASWNREFYQFLATNSRYVTILDADEFLFGRSGSNFSAAFVKQILAERQLDVFCGIWVDAMHISGQVLDDLPTKWTINTSPDRIRAGAFAGKSIVSTKKIFECEHIGHNLHYAALYSHVSDASFGEIIVLHLTTLPASTAKARLLRKIVAYAARSLAIAVVTRGQIEEMSLCDKIPSNIRNYAKSYLSASDESNISDSGPDLAMQLEIMTNRVQEIIPLSLMIQEIDFKSFIQRSWTVISDNAKTT